MRRRMKDKVESVSIEINKINRIFKIIISATSIYKYTKNINEKYTSFHSLIPLLSNYIIKTNLQNLTLTY